MNKLLLTSSVPYFLNISDLLFNFIMFKSIFLINIFVLVLVICFDDIQNMYMIFILHIYKLHMYI